MVNTTKLTVHTVVVGNGLKLSVQVEDGKQTVTFIVQTVKGEVAVDAATAQAILAMR